MFRVCNRYRTSSVSLRRFTTFPQAFPAEFNKLRNMGLWAGAGIATASAFYYMKSDEANSNVEVGNEVLRSESSTGITEVEVRRRIKSAYGYVLGGLGVTSASAFTFYGANLHRLIPGFYPVVFCWVNLTIVMPALSVGIYSTDYKTQSHLKHLFWCAYHVSMSGLMSVLGFVFGPIGSQALLAIACMVGGQALKASKAPLDSLHENDGRGMNRGVLVSIVLGNMIFPMPLLHNVVLYGGLAFFSELLPTEPQWVQKMLDRARNEENFDPMHESLDIYAGSILFPSRIATFLWEKRPRRNSK